jgi:pyruvyltransferase
MQIKAWLRENNFGDLLNKDLIYQMTGFVPELVPANQTLEKDNYLIIGSTLQYCDSNSIIWGAGLLSNEEKIQVKPKKILAVRGPLTREELIKQDINCPEIYGDPALLLPKYYNPKIEKKYKLGVIPHWGDVIKYNNDYLNLKNDPEVCFIAPDLTTYEFIDSILSCEKIISSSLHGIICADAYGISSVQVSFGNPIYQFKFDDYYLSVGKELKVPYMIQKEDTKEKILNSFIFYEKEIKIDLNKLMGVCPFKDIVVISPFSRKLRNDKENPKNYPYWEEVIKELKNRGVYTIQIGVKEEKYLGANNFLIDLSLEELKIILDRSKAWVSIDNFLPHLASLIGKSGIVIFSQSDPNIFGHNTNDNLLKDRKYLRKDQFGIWESVEIDKESYIDVNVVIECIMRKIKNG